MQSIIKSLIQDENLYEGTRNTLLSNCVLKYKPTTNFVAVDADWLKCYYEKIYQEKDKKKSFQEGLCYQEKLCRLNQNKEKPSQLNQKKIVYKQPIENFLTQHERETLEALQRKKENAKQSDKIKVILLLNKGLKFKEVAESVFLSEDTVRRYYRMYLSKGMEQLLELHYKGLPCRLNQSQLEALETHLKQQPPKSAQEVAKFIKERFKVEYTSVGALRLLHRLNFSYKKPKLIPGKANAEDQKEFLKKSSELDKKLGEEDVKLYMDAVHPQHNSKPSHAWFPKGVEIILKSNTGRKRTNINAVLNPATLEVISDTSDSVNAQSTIDLLRKVEKRYPNAKRIIIICDNARYYRSKKLKEYLETSRIELRFLPPYSPNLNLIERLWRFMNEKVRNNKYYENFSDFQKAIDEFFKNIPTLYREELKKLLSERFYVISA